MYKITKMLMSNNILVDILLIILFILWLPIGVLIELVKMQGK